MTGRTFMSKGERAAGYVAGFLLCTEKIPSIAVCDVGIVFAFLRFLGLYTKEDYIGFWLAG